MTSPIVAVACLTMGAIAWAGDPFPLGPGFRVDEQTGGYYPAYRPDVAAGSQGNFVVSWDGQDATTNYGAFARPFDQADTPLTGNLLLSEPLDFALFASVTADADGDFVVVWNEDPVAPLGSYYIRGRSVSAAGIVQGAEFTVGSVSYYEYEPRAASMPNGEFVVVWDDFEYGSYPYQYTIKGRRYDAAGVATGLEFTVEPNGASRQVGPQIGMDADGNFVVAWLDYQPFGTPSVVRAQRFEAPSTPDGTDFVVTTDAYSSYSNDGRLPAVGMNDAGAFVVVWEDESVSLMLAQRYDATASPEGSPLLLADSTGGSPVRRPDVDMFDDGSFVAVWERDYEIRGRSFDAGTTTMSSEFHVTAGDAGRFPAVATYDGPGFVVVWDDDGGPGLYARRFVFPDQVGVSAKKLVVVDKLAAAGKAKLVYVANNDGGITKGTGTDVDAISAQLTVAYADGSTMGAFVLPAGASDGTSGWKVNKDTVAKYVNKTAPDGPTQAKAGVVKPGKLLKLVGKGLGDTPIDIFGAGAPTMQPSGQVVTSYCMVNGGEATCHCTTFAECSYKLIAADTGAKLVCKNGGPDADCAAVGGP